MLTSSSFLLFPLLFSLGILNHLRINGEKCNKQLNTRPVRGAIKKREKRAYALD